MLKTDRRARCAREKQSPGDGRSWTTPPRDANERSRAEQVHVVRGEPGQDGGEAPRKNAMQWGVCGTAIANTPTPEPDMYTSMKGS